MEWLSKVEDAHLELTAEIQIYLDRTGANATEDPTDQVTSHSLAKDKAELIELAENMKTLFSEFSAQLKSSGGPRLTKEDVTSSFLSRGKASLSHRNIDAIPEEDADAFSAFGSLRQVPMRKSFASSSCLTDSNAPTASKWSMRDVSSIRRSSLDLRPVHSAEKTVLYEDDESIVFAKPSVKPKSTFGTTSSRQSSFAWRSSRLLSNTKRGTSGYEEEFDITLGPRPNHTTYARRYEDAEDEPVLPGVDPNPHFTSALMHMLPKSDIPILNGEPMMWPRWITAWKNLVHRAGIPDSHKISLLQQYLSPKVQQEIGIALYNPEMYLEVMATLKAYYGMPELVATRHLDTILQAAPVTDGDRKGLTQLILNIR